VIPSGQVGPAYTGLMGQALPAHDDASAQAPMAGGGVRVAGARDLGIQRSVGGWWPLAVPGDPVDDLLAGRPTWNSQPNGV
jgi:hypothetical protein